ncbi:CAMK family protein kinase [Tritrichomonas foetus]|uniref:CAMK family protein kinase n=1 Tax=Tritrichomonas foetus TaxID=1144522 RepID=A0A1J4JGM6_9EUKA|nr:CAMK family protein kinase [Tritrichomonas foetus]|eukprot:OHS97825.1 CAMK family protein kinase [Tritrichomonas foetus]
MNQTIIAPSSIGPYTFHGTIGSGAFSIVKLAYHEAEKTFYACKIVPKFRLIHNDMMKRFETEIIINQQIHHPGVVGIIDVLKDNFNFYIFMDYCQNGDLFQFIIDQNRFSENDSKPIICQLLETLRYIHKLGIAHRDLKPENILMDSNFNVKISDFGLSKFVVQNHLTSTPCGSPCYASPECISGKPYDPLKSDIWSVGIIIFAMLTAHIPWTKHNKNQLFKQIQEGQFTVPDYISEKAESFIRGLICVDPEKRLTIEQAFEHPFLKDTHHAFNDPSPVKMINIRRIDQLFDHDRQSTENILNPEKVNHFSLSSSQENLTFSKALKIVESKIPTLYIRTQVSFTDSMAQKVNIAPAINTKRNLPPMPLECIADARKTVARKSLSGNITILQKLKIRSMVGFGMPIEPRILIKKDLTKKKSLSHA